MISINNDFHLSNSDYLDLDQRSDWIKNEIEERFVRVFNGSVEDWNYQGKDHYCTCGIDEHLLLKRVIQLSPECKEFYAIDLGAGNFQWVDALAAYIDSQTDLPDDIIVHIIGVRGEAYEDTAVKTHRCVKHKLGSFKIENLSEEFQHRKYTLEDKEYSFDLENKVHLIESEWTLVHLFDPLGTLAQAYNLLCPQGFFLFDKFYLDHEKGPTFVPSQKIITQLLNDLQVDYLTANFWNRDQFALRKLNDQPCCLPVKYPEHDVGEIYYERTIPETICLQQGKSELFKWLKNNGIYLENIFLKAS